MKTLLSLLLLFPMVSFAEYVTVCPWDVTEPCQTVWVVDNNTNNYQFNTYNNQSFGRF